MYFFEIVFKTYIYQPQNKTECKNVNKNKSQYLSVFYIYNLHNTRSDLHYILVNKQNNCNFITH